MKKWIIGITIVLVVLISAIYLYINQAHRSIEAEEAIDIDAVSLFRAFQEDETTANLKYLNKAVRVHGKINSVEKNTDGKTVLVLKSEDSLFGINCTLEGNMDLKPGEEIVIKGICTGYLSDVVLTGCMIE